MFDGLHLIPAQCHDWVVRGHDVDRLQEPCPCSVRGGLLFVVFLTSTTCCLTEDILLRAHRVILSKRLGWRVLRGEFGALFNATHSWKSTKSFNGPSETSLKRFSFSSVSGGIVNVCLEGHSSSYGTSVMKYSLLLDVGQMFCCAPLQRPSTLCPMEAAPERLACTLPHYWNCNCSGEPLLASIVLCSLHIKHRCCSSCVAGAFIFFVISGLLVWFFQHLPQVSLAPSSSGPCTVVPGSLAPVLSISIKFFPSSVLSSLTFPHFLPQSEMLTWHCWGV